MQVLSRQRGVSLIEVLVAMLIFSIGVLGIALMQIKGAQYTKQAGARTVAVLQARSLADAMRANPAGVYGVASETDIASKNGHLSDSYYAYDGTATPSSSGCPNAACKQAKGDLARWVTQLRAGAAVPLKANGSADASGLALVTVRGTDPTGASSADASQSGTLVITSSWSGMRANASGVPTNDSYSFDYQPSQF